MVAALNHVELWDVAFLQGYCHADREITHWEVDAEIGISDDHICEIGCADVRGH